ncbi:MAG: response regulator [Actinobacteria bacterium]|nr:response regulator [Actinomycetota bacterium]
MSVRVLVVDDTDHVRTMLVDMLQLDGFEVCGEAASGPDAMASAGRLDPEVIIMDYKMPGMNGLEASRAIREQRPNQPIILYTAYLDPKLEEEARQAGVAICIGKVEGLGRLERHITELARDLAS